MSKVKIAVHVPPEAAEAVRRAIGEAGAGAIGEYTFCSFSVSGTGRYMPGDAARPYGGGESGRVQQIPEERVEVTCDRGDAKRVIAALKSAHPYEEPTYDIYQLIDEEEL
jgi:hypothetical protein